MKKKIDIGVATVCRRDGFSFLLKSLQAIKLETVEVEKLYVVCNTEDKFYIEYVKLELSKQRYSYELIVEEKRGISFARNHVLKKATSTFVAFLDDDEWVDENWLENLSLNIDKYNADVVFGPVISSTQENTSIWTRAQIRPRYLTGTTVPYGGTGNVLMKTSAFREQGLLFDEDFGLSGGEDTEFFSRMKRMDKTLIWCDEALAFEHTDKDRRTFAWAVRRAYRGGQTYARILKLHRVESSKFLSEIIILILKIVARFIFFLALVLIGQWGKSARNFLSMVSYFGRVTIEFSENKYFLEYKN